MVHLLAHGYTLPFVQTSICKTRSHWLRDLKRRGYIRAYTPSAEGVYWLPVCTCEASAFYKKNSTNSYPLPRRLLLPTTILFLYICKWNSLKNVFLPFFNCIVVQFSQFTRSGSTVHVRNYDPLPPSPRVQLYRRERGAERNRCKSSEIALKLRYPANLAQHSASKHR